MKRRFQIYLMTFIFCLLTGFVSASGEAAAAGMTDKNQKKEAAVSDETDKNQKQKTVLNGTDNDQGQKMNSDAADKEQKQVKASGNKKKKRGWVTLENGTKKYFNKKGAYVTGLKKIDGQTYSFNAHGRLQTNKWVIYDGNKYHTDANGVLNVGMTRINGKYYYFGSDGSLRTNEWISYNGGRYRADSQGVIVQGEFVTIDGKVYYLKKNGTVYTGWGTVNGKKAYFYPDGAMAVGLTEIDGKYYYFDTDGTMKTGTVEADGTTYYMAEDGTLEARKEKDVYYDSSNKKMTDVEALDFETLQRAKKIVSEITDSSMSQAQKLRKCFDWVMAKTYVTRRKFTNAPGWIALYANDHFIYGSGNCQSDAAAFGYLAKALGYTEVYMCVDSKGSGHSWTEIDGLVYDPLFAQAKSFSQNYGVRYGVYKLRAIQHVKI